MIMKDHYEVKIYVENDVGVLVEKSMSIPRKFDVEVDEETRIKEKKVPTMVYYMQLDKNKEFL